MFPPPVAKYHQLATTLSRQIQAGQWQAGEQLPTEAELCQRFNVSRGTVRKGLELLIQQGLIKREQGRGTFVKQSQPLTTLFTLSNFDDELSRQQRESSVRLLRVEQRSATAGEGDKLGLNAGASVLHIVRLRLANGRPVAHEARTLAASLCPQLLDEDLKQASIHSLLTQKYAIPLLRLEHVVEIRPLTAVQASLLEVAPHSLAFFVDRLTFTETDGVRHPAVWFQAIYCDDHVNLTAQAQLTL